MVSIADHHVLGLHACVLHTDRTVSCWGPGHEGSLGQGDETSHYLPVEVPGIADAVAVSAGAYFTCAVHSDGEVSCWGSNAYGELGRGSGGSSKAPVRVPGLVEVVAIAAGPHTSCAVHRDGGVSCWGAGFGDTPSPVESLNSTVSISVGSRGACAATVDRHVYCWPLSSSGGSGPARVGDIDDVVAVTVGDGSVCALHSDGGVSCWGANNAGQLGNGTTTAASRPARVPGIGDAVAVSISLGSSKVGAHACALHENGSASCWGGNNLGQLGDGTYENALRPRPVVPFERVPASQIPEIRRRCCEHGSTLRFSSGRRTSRGCASRGITYAIGLWRPLPDLRCHREHFLLCGGRLVRLPVRTHDSLQHGVRGNRARTGARL